MGTTSSSQSDNKTRSSSGGGSQVCRYCAAPLKDRKKVTLGEACTRCGGLAKAKTKTPVQRDGSSGLDGKEEEDLRAPCSRMHILPFKDTLPTEEDKDTGEDALLKNYILPYFHEKKPYVKIGDRFQIKSIDFRIMSCHPPEGYITTDTKIRAFGNPISVDNKVTKVHCLPTKATLPSDWKADSKKYSDEQLYANYVKPYFGQEETKYIVEGDTFLSKGIQFKIIAADPKDGEVGRDTKVFTHGQPIQDLAKIHILPIYETLPNHHKELTEEKLFEIYLFPYFSGRFRYCAKDDEIDIDGVDFRVMAVEPEGVSGIVTDATRMYANGPFIRYGDLKQQQLAADEELARSLQRQESVAPQALVMQQRLEELLRSMPLNDPHRPMIVRINQSLTLLPYLSSETIDRSILPMLSGLQPIMGDPSNAAAPQSDIESLPTRVYQPKVKKETDSKNSDEEFNSCRICLSDYEAGEELRTLPCFHSYHKTCIDKWLQTNRKCPICKNPITSNS